MTVTVTTLQASDNLTVMGETLRPLLTNDMGSAIEIFDTQGPAGAGPVPHRHPWEEVYLVLAGQLEVTVENTSQVLDAGALAHIPADTTHSYRNLTDDTRFLTITTSGNAARFFTQVASEVQTNPPDIPAIIRIAAIHDIEFAG
jgi:quercetin dioxygenase-like cupin family protein